MESTSSLSDEEKLKLSVYSAVSKVADEVGQNNTFIGKFDISPEAKVVMTELLWKKLQIYAEDLEAFAQHAKRNQIKVDDVKLLFRRNQKIIEEISKLENEETIEKQNEKSGKRKRNSAAEKE